MLKIKDNVDLKELEKFYFYEKGACYMKSSMITGDIFVDKDTREITRLHICDTRTIPTKGEIRDLVNADLVEEVEDK